MSINCNHSSNKNEKETIKNFNSILDSNKILPRLITNVRHNDVEIGHTIYNIINQFEQEYTSEIDKQYIIGCMISKFNIPSNDAIYYVNIGILFKLLHEQFGFPISKISSTLNGYLKFNLKLWINAFNLNSNKILVNIYSNDNNNFDLKIRINASGHKWDSLSTTKRLNNKYTFEYQLNKNKTPEELFLTEDLSRWKRFFKNHSLGSYKNNIKFIAKSTVNRLVISDSIKTREEADAFIELLEQEFITHKI